MLAPIQHWVNIYCDNFFLIIILLHSIDVTIYLTQPPSFTGAADLYILTWMNDVVQVRSDLHKVSHTFVVSLKAHLLNSITNHPDTVFLTHVFSLHHFYKSIQHQLFESNPFISSLNNYLPVSRQCFWHFQFSIQTILKQFC